MKKDERYLAQLQAILDHLTEGLVIADLEGNLFHWNPAALAMHGFASLDECRRKLMEFTDLFELSTEQEGILPLEQWPLARILRDESLNGWEVHVRRRDSDWQRVFSYGGTLARDKEGKPILAVVSITDITQRKNVEETDARLAAIVESSDDAIIGKDMNGSITAWNGGAERLLGYRAGEIIGRPVSLLIPPGQQKEEETILQRLLSGQRIEP